MTTSTEVALNILKRLTASKCLPLDCLEAKPVLAALVSKGYQPAVSANHRAQHQLAPVSAPPAASESDPAPPQAISAPWTVLVAVSMVYVVHHLHRVQPVHSLHLGTQHAVTNHMYAEGSHVAWPTDAVLGRMGPKQQPEHRVHPVTFAAVVHMKAAACWTLADQLMVGWWGRAAAHVSMYLSVCLQMAALWLVHACLACRQAAEPRCRAVVLLVPGLANARILAQP